MVYLLTVAHVRVYCYWSLRPPKFKNNSPPRVSVLGVTRLLLVTCTCAPTVAAALVVPWVTPQHAVRNVYFYLKVHGVPRGAAIASYIAQYSPLGA